MESRSEYRRLFEGAEEARYRCEASTSYLWDPAVPESIAADCADPRIVISVREPIARAASHHSDDVRDGFESRTFDQAVADFEPGPRPWGHPDVRISLGRYAPLARRYVDRFGPHRVHFVVFERLREDPEGEARRLFEWLDLDFDLDALGGMPHSNPGETARGRISGGMLRSWRIRRTARAIVPRRSRQAAYRLMLRGARKPTLDSGSVAKLRRFYAGDARELEELSDRRLPWSF